MNIRRGKVAEFKLHEHTTQVERPKLFFHAMTTIVFSSPIPSFPLFITQETISY